LKFSIIDDVIVGKKQSHSEAFHVVDTTSTSISNEKPILRHIDAVYAYISALHFEGLTLIDKTMIKSSKVQYKNVCINM